MRKIGKGLMTGVFIMIIDAYSTKSINVKRGPSSVQTTFDIDGGGGASH